MGTAAKLPTPPRKTARDRKQVRSESTMGLSGTCLATTILERINAPGPRRMRTPEQDVPRAARLVLSTQRKWLLLFTGQMPRRSGLAASGATRYHPGTAAGVSRHRAIIALIGAPVLDLTPHMLGRSASMRSRFPITIRSRHNALEQLRSVRGHRHHHTRDDAHILPLYP